MLIAFMMRFNKHSERTIKMDKEQKLVHKLEKLQHYLLGAQSVCDNESISDTFYDAADTIVDILEWLDKGSD
jgi:hypothetical protein